jgi:hypothetical protein
MLVPAWNASPRAILTISRVALLVLAAAAALAVLIALRPGTDAHPAGRPVFVRRMDALPTVVVARPPIREAPAEAAPDDSDGR